MKIDRLIAAFAFVLALAVSPGLAQPKPAATAPAQSTANVPESKIALIYSDAFLDAKTGISRFTTLINNLNREFQPRQTKLQKDFQREGEDAQAAYNKRRTEMFSPLQDDIGKALEVYAKAHNINVIIDGSQVPLVYAAEPLDITRAFINEFNSKNPATAAVTPPN